MGRVHDHAGGSLSLADIPRAITAWLQKAIQPDYSLDAGWVQYNLKLGTLPPSSLAGRAMAAGINPLAFVKQGGGLISQQEADKLLSEYNLEVL